MGSITTDADDVLRAAWHEFCDELKSCGDELFHDKLLAVTPQERAETFRYLAQSMSLGFLFHVENRMEQHPYLLRYFVPDRKQAGDNADAIILGAFIDGSETYRISGTRGTCRWVAFTVLRPTRPGEPRHPMGSPYNYVLDAAPLLPPDLIVEEDGTIEVILSPHEHPGNWIRTTPETGHVRVRQFFGDWATEQPAELRIERVGESLPPPPLLTPERWMLGLKDVADFVHASASVWPAMASEQLNVMAARVNMGMSPGESWDGKVDANPGGVNGGCHWKVAADEALVIEWMPTPAYFWLVELDTIWNATVDYRWRLSNVNSTLAATEPDGSVRVVLSHQDPRVPNWLDLSGWSEGKLNLRMLLCTEVPEFRTRLVKLSELAGLLPDDACRMDAAGRAEQIRLRREGVFARFGV